MCNQYQAKLWERGENGEQAAKKRTRRMDRLVDKQRRRLLHVHKDVPALPPPLASCLGGDTRRCGHEAVRIARFHKMTTATAGAGNLTLRPRRIRTTSCDKGGNGNKVRSKSRSRGRGRGRGRNRGKGGGIENGNGAESVVAVLVRLLVVAAAAATTTTLTASTVVVALNAAAFLPVSPLALNVWAAKKCDYATNGNWERQRRQQRQQRPRPPLLESRRQRRQRQRLSLSSPRHDASSSSSSSWLFAPARASAEASNASGGSDNNKGWTANDEKKDCHKVGGEALSATFSPPLLPTLLSSPSPLPSPSPSSKSTSMTINAVTKLTTRETTKTKKQPNEKRSDLAIPSLVVTKTTTASAPANGESKSVSKGDGIKNKETKVKENEKQQQGREEGKEEEELTTRETTKTKKQPNEKRPDLEIPSLIVTKTTTGSAPANGESKSVSKGDGIKNKETKVKTNEQKQQQGKGKEEVEEEEEEDFNVTYRDDYLTRLELLERLKEQLRQKKHTNASPSYARAPPSSLPLSLSSLSLSSSTTSSLSSAQAGLSKFHRSLLSPTLHRQRFVTGRYPLLVSVRDDPTRKWLGQAAPSRLLVNGTIVDRSLASYDRYQWLDTDQRKKEGGDVFWSLELIAEIHAQKPGYLNVLSGDGAGASASMRRMLRERYGGWKSRWKKTRKRTRTKMDGEEEEKEEEKEEETEERPNGNRWWQTRRGGEGSERTAASSERLWITGFSLTRRNGELGYVDVGTGRMGIVNRRTAMAIRWPNEVTSVPFSTDAGRGGGGGKDEEKGEALTTTLSRPGIAGRRGVTESKHHHRNDENGNNDDDGNYDYHDGYHDIELADHEDALLVSDGFLVPGRDKGGLYVVKYPGDDRAEWRVCLTGGKGGGGGGSKSVSDSSKSKKTLARGDDSHDNDGGDDDDDDDSDGGGWFYHRAVWVDLTGDGRQSILTARAKIPSILKKGAAKGGAGAAATGAGCGVASIRGGGGNRGPDSRKGASAAYSSPTAAAEGQLVWLERPKPHRYDPETGTPLDADDTVFDPFGTNNTPWKTRVLDRGPDVMFAVADLEPSDGTIEVIASQFFDRKVTVHSIKVGPEPEVVFRRTVDNRCGAAFSAVLADLDGPSLPSSSSSSSSSFDAHNRDGEYDGKAGGNEKEEAIGEDRGRERSAIRPMVMDSGSTVPTLVRGDGFSHVLVTSHECTFDEKRPSGGEDENGARRAAAADRRGGMRGFGGGEFDIRVMDEPSSDAAERPSPSSLSSSSSPRPSDGSDSIDGGSLFAYRIPSGPKGTEWRTEPWKRTVMATGFRVRGQLGNIINPGAPGFCYTFYPTRRGRDGGGGGDVQRWSRPLIGISGDCAEAAYILRPHEDENEEDNDDDDKREAGGKRADERGEDRSARYRLVCEIETGATVGSLAIGYDDFCDAEQQSGYAKIYIPCYERDRVLVFAMGTGEDEDVDDVNGSTGWF